MPAPKAELWIKGCNFVKSILKHKRITNEILLGHFFSRNMMDLTDLMDPVCWGICEWKSQIVLI